MGSLSPWHWLILIGVGVLLFGAKKLPDAARSLGKSMRIFKSEVRELQAENAAAPVPPAQPPVQPPTEVSPAQPARVVSERVEAPAPAPNPTDSRPA